jgi:tetratricopeptide (TPR) repeat protein
MPSSNDPVIRLFVLSWLILVITVAPLTGGNVPVLPPHPAAVLDSLFAAGAYDSVLSLVPAVLEDAHARGDSTLVARALIIRGRVELTVRNSVDAERTLEEARRIAEAARDTARWSDALGFKSIATTFQGRYQESIELNEKRLNLAQRIGDVVAEAWARTAMAYVYLKTGQFERAKTEYTIAADLFRSENRPREELTPLVGLGRALNDLGETDAARDVYLRVWRTARQLGDLDQEAYAVTNLGWWEFRFGDVATAARYFERAHDLHVQTGNLRASIVPATDVAVARMYLGQYADAAAILSDAARTCESGGHDDQLGFVLNISGEVRLLQNRVHEAAALYRRSLAMGEALTSGQRDGAYYGLASALAEMDSTKSAAAVLTAGLDHAPEAQFESSMGALLSQCLRRMGRYDEALTRALSAAHSAQVYGAYDHVVRSAFELSAAYAAVGDAEYAETWYWRGLDALESRRHSSDEPEWREAHGRIDYVVDGGHVVLQKLDGSVRADGVSALFHAVQRFKARTLAERITEPHKQTDLSPDMASLAPIRLNDLQSAVLRPGELLLDFAVGDQTAYLFAVTRDSCRVVSLPGKRSDLPAQISFYLETIGHPPDGSVGDTEIERMGASLFATLLGGVADLVYSASRVIVAPDSYAAAVPFAALALPVPAGGGAMLDAKEVWNVPSATVLQWLRTNGDRDESFVSGRRMLVLVPSDYQELEGAAREEAKLRARITGVEVMRGKPDLIFLDDPANRFEAIHVAAHVDINDQKPWHSGILLDTKAAATTSRPRPASNEWVRRGVNPIDINGIASDLPLQDPYLRAGDIASRLVRARLAVLSGCESALGRVSSGEGVLGLTSAFLSAGVPAVVATLWPVDDAVTADLMDAFYTGLTRGETVSSALRHAQEAIRERRGTGHPFYWAGFVVVGNGDIAVDLDRSRRVSPMIYVGIGAIILLVGLIIRHWRITPPKKSRSAV